MKICKVSDCERRHYGKGLCRAHLARLRRTGTVGLDPIGKPHRPHPPMSDRFWAKVDKRGDDECWEWTGARHSAGYGVFSGVEESGYAHRHAYTIKFGPIPPGLVIDHKCRNRICVNPGHLHAVSNTMNCENRAAEGSGRSELRGISWHEDTQSWVVFVAHRGKKHFGGRHSTIEEAQTRLIKLRNSLHTNNITDRQEETNATE